MEPPGHQRSMTSYMTRNSFFRIFTPKNYPRAFKNHRNVFYSSQGTRWTLKFCCSSIRRKVIGDHGFSSISALDLTSEVTGWPRTLSLYINLFVSRRATRSFFFREALAQSGAKRKGRTTPPPPLCCGRMRNGLCRRGLTRQRWWYKIRCSTFKIKDFIGEKPFWKFFEFWPLVTSILTWAKKWPKWFRNDFSRAFERCLSFLATLTRSRDHGGGVQTPPPPPAGGGKSRGPAGRGLSQWSKNNVCFMQECGAVQLWQLRLFGAAPAPAPGSNFPKFEPVRAHSGNSRDFLAAHWEFFTKCVKISSNP